MLIKYKNIIPLLMLSICSSVVAQGGSQKSFMPFDLNNQNLTLSIADNKDIGNQLNTGLLLDYESFDFLRQRSNGYLLQANRGGLFGDEIVMGMKFSDFLSLRVNVIENDGHSSLLLGLGDYSQPNGSSEQLAGYRFGISSVLNFGSDWKLGLDLGHGQIEGDLLGLSNDKMNTTSLGLGVRYQNFGATLNSNFLTRNSNDLLEQSTLNLKVDWHFTKEGIISFGARKSVRENTQSTSSVLDRLTGTVPYIKFKHNL